MLALAAAFLAGCAHELARAPLLYQGSPVNPWANVPADLRTAEMNVLYATDRNTTSLDGKISYGSGRSNSMAFGEVTVSCGQGLTWDQLEHASRNPQRDLDLELRVGFPRELGRFPASGQPVDLINGKPVEPPAIVESERAALDALHTELRRRLAQSPRKEAFVFVHGYANRFDDSALRTAQLYHYLGRQFVPIAYTWPAGSDYGPLRGYTHDRESGEYTIYHLRRFLIALAACPELERIHIVAHSRGTDVLMSTLRELKLMLGDDPITARQKLKLGTVVLAAPDLDWEVSQQRIAADRLTFFPTYLTVYTSPHDKAIAIADWLFGSLRRLGQLSDQDLTRSQQRALSEQGIIEIVRVTRETNGTGHDYFISDPAVLSDLILLLRDGKRAGVANGRPLTPAPSGLWELDENYLVGSKTK